MIELDNRTDTDVSIDTIEQIAHALTVRDIELILCSDEQIASINAEHRAKKTPTDVLSFPLDGDMEHMPLGSIVISVDRVIDKSTELGHSVDDELVLLFVHGLLHLLGYDHETDSGEMRAKERDIVQQFALPDSLIVRTKGE